MNLTAILEGKFREIPYFYLVKEQLKYSSYIVALLILFIYLHPAFIIFKDNLSGKLIQHTPLLFFSLQQ